MLRRRLMPYAMSAAMSADDAAPCLLVDISFDTMIRRRYAISMPLRFSFSLSCDVIFREMLDDDITLSCRLVFCRAYATCRRLMLMLSCLLSRLPIAPAIGVITMPRLLRRYALATPPLIQPPDIREGYIVIALTTRRVMMLMFCCCALYLRHFRSAMVALRHMPLLLADACFSDTAV